ncbi:MAG: pyrroloquinoline quinone biosynthesis protein PqqB, partial [Candidatus Atribacteria bacterium]
MMTHPIEVVILGTAQDGGIPQLGCRCSHCQAAWRDPSRRQWAASLAILDHAAKEMWLVEATPDIREQMHDLGISYPEYRLVGVLLTHAHVGHYLGLALLGRESWNTRRLPVLCTYRLAEFLRMNQPWKQLIELDNIALSVIEPDIPVHLSPAIIVTPILVPHRDELSDTVAFHI